jgi:hypothetical protein
MCVVPNRAQLATRLTLCDIGKDCDGAFGRLLACVKSSGEPDFGITGPLSPRLYTAA